MKGTAMNRQPAKRPTHRVYAVTERGEAKAFWTAIGAAWPHRDGQGYNVELSCIPTPAPASSSAWRVRPARPDSAAPGGNKKHGAGAAELRPLFSAC
jgi:hypothetical protein